MLEPSAWSLSCNNSTVSFALPCAIYFSAWSSTKLCQAFLRKFLEGLQQRLCHNCGLTCFALQLFFCHRLGIRLLELDPFSTDFILLWRPDPGWGPYGPIYGPIWAYIYGPIYAPLWAYIWDHMGPYGSSWTGLGDSVNFPWDNLDQFESFRVQKWYFYEISRWFCIIFVGEAQKSRYFDQKP